MPFTATDVLAGAKAGDVVIDTAAAGEPGHATIFELTDDTAPPVLEELLPQEYKVMIAIMNNKPIVPKCTTLTFFIVIPSIMTIFPNN